MSGRPGRAARFILGALVLFLGVLLAARPTQAQDGSLEEQTREIAKNLNCPTCAGRNLADCPTDTCAQWKGEISTQLKACLLYTSPSPRDRTRSRMPSSA